MSKNQKYILAIIIIPFVVNSFFVVVEWFTISRFGNEDILLSLIFLMLLMLLSLILILVAIVGTLFKKTRKISVFLLLFCIIFFLSGNLCRYLGAKARMNGFYRLADRSAPLIDAIQEYANEYGAPPVTLDDLVPKYINEIPKTGMGAYPDYEYEIFSETEGILVWYDLGARKVEEFNGLWVYPDGDPTHAIVTFMVDSENNVIDSNLDRMPDEFGQIPFDEAVWLQKQQRIEMILSFLQTTNVNGITINELDGMLGPPDGERIIKGPLWELRVQCSCGPLNWDVFFYWPTGDYPEYIYGGVVERVNNWAYVWE